MPKNRRRDVIINELIVSLRAERRRAGRSLNDVAASAGLSHTMVSRVEKRERLPTIDTLLRIADALHIRLSAVLAEAEDAADPNPEPKERA